MQSSLPAWSSGTSPQLRQIFPARRHQLLGAKIVVFLLVPIFVFFAYRRPDTLNLTTSLRSHHKDVYNRTLGFQKVFAIGFPGRTDKSDALNLAASISGFDIDWEPGVNFKDIPDKAINDNWDKRFPTMIASYRAHLNVLMRVVNEGLQSALIFEDDMDWDVTFRDQLAMYAKGTRLVQGSSDTHSPYGSDWDVHWLGHCRTGSNDEEQPIFVIEDDSTVPPTDKRNSWFVQMHVPDFINSNSSRVIFKANGALCTFAYAVTLQSARKIVTALSLGADAQPFDVAMNRICGNRFKQSFNCHSVYPPLVSSHRFQGSYSHDSDIQHKPASKFHAEYTTDIVYSVIQNLPSIVNGSTEVKSQWPDATMATSRDMRALWANEVQTELRTVRMSEEPRITVKGINTKPEVVVHSIETQSTATVPTATSVPEADMIPQE